MRFLSKNARMDLGSAARSTGAEWIGQPPHEDLAARAPPAASRRRPVLRAARRLPACPPGHRAAQPRRRAGVSGADPAARSPPPSCCTGPPTCTAMPEAAATTVIVPAERVAGGRHARWSPTSARSTPSRRAASRRMRCAAAPRRPARSHSSSSCWSPPPSPRAGRCRCPTTRAATACGARPYEPGYHVLDGLRAALSTERLGLSPDAPVGLWGYSGGGLASAWAAEMSGSYAPELNIVGAVLGSPVGDLGHTFRRLNGTFMSGLPALVVAALAHIYPDLDRGHPGARHRRGQGAAAAAAQR